MASNNVHDEMVAGEKIENKELGEKMKKGKEKRGKLHTKTEEKALKMHLFGFAQYISLSIIEFRVTSNAFCSPIKLIFVYWFTI